MFKAIKPVIIAWIDDMELHIMLSVILVLILSASLVQ
jgi:hypothetical protein